MKIKFILMLILPFVFIIGCTQSPIVILNSQSKFIQEVQSSEKHNCQFLNNDVVISFNGFPRIKSENYKNARNITLKHRSQMLHLTINRSMNYMLYNRQTIGVLVHG